MLKSVFRIETDGEPVLTWKGVLISIGIYPLYVFIFPLLTQLAMMFYFTLGENGLSFAEALDWTRADQNIILINIIAYGLSAAFILLLFSRFVWASLKHSVKTFSAVLPVTIVLGLIVYVVLSAVVGAQLRKYGLVESENNTAVTAMIRENAPAMLVLTCVLAPFVEEFIFRAAWFRPLWRKFAPAAALLGLFLFGLHHVWSAVLTGFNPAYWNYTELIYILQYLPGGLVMIYCYCLNKNIWSAILMHSVVNLLATLLTIYVDTGIRVF